MPREARHFNCLSFVVNHQILRQSLSKTKAHIAAGIKEPGIPVSNKRFLITLAVSGKGVMNPAHLKCNPMAIILHIRPKTPVVQQIVAIPLHPGSKLCGIISGRNIPREIPIPNTKHIILSFSIFLILQY